MITLSEGEVWKLKIIEDISLTRKELVETAFDDKFLEEILDFVCTS